MVALRPLGVGLAEAALSPQRGVVLAQGPVGFGRLVEGRQPIGVLGQQLVDSGLVGGAHRFDVALAQLAVIGNAVLAPGHGQRGWACAQAGGLRETHPGVPVVALEEVF